MSEQRWQKSLHICNSEQSLLYSDSNSDNSVDHDKLTDTLSEDDNEQVKSDESGRDGNTCQITKDKGNSSVMIWGAGCVKGYK
jgi:hypothetical protein